MYEQVRGQLDQFDADEKKLFFRKLLEVQAAAAHAARREKTRTAFKSANTRVNLMNRLAPSSIIPEAVSQAASRMSHAASRKSRATRKTKQHERTRKEGDAYGSAMGIEEAVAALLQATGDELEDVLRNLDFEEVSSFQRRLNRAVNALPTMGERVTRGANLAHSRTESPDERGAPEPTPEPAPTDEPKQQPQPEPTSAAEPEQSLAERLLDSSRWVQSQPVPKPQPQPKAAPAPAPAPSNFISGLLDSTRWGVKQGAVQAV
jgi:hypothetical protein